MRNAARRRQFGFTAIELLVAIAVAISALSLGAIQVNRYMESLEHQTAADHAVQVSQAAQRYIRDYYANVASVAGPAVPFTNLSVAILKGLGGLPNSLSDTNNYGQSYSFAVLEPTPGRLELLIVTTGGTAISDLGLRRIAQRIGAQGGYIASTSTTTATGAFGGWTIALPGFYGLNPGGGRLAIATFFADSATSNDFLYRNEVTGQPALNTMNTPIIFNSTQTVGAACSTAGAIANDTAGALVNCTGGTWKLAGSAFWADPVATFASLPACNAAALGVTRVVRTPTSGTGPRAYTCNGTTWAALAVDDQGVLTTGKLTLSDVVTAGATCTTTGQVSRDSTGQILSCQSGVWQGAEGLGYGQTWTDMTSVRSLGVTYSNNSGKPIMGRLTAWASGGTLSLSITINGYYAGIMRPAHHPVGGVYYSGDTFLVPKDSTYRLDCYQCWGSGLVAWHELR